MTRLRAAAPVFINMFRFARMANDGQMQGSCELEIDTGFVMRFYLDGKSKDYIIIRSSSLTQETQALIASAGSLLRRMPT